MYGSMQQQLLTRSARSVTRGCTRPNGSSPRRRTPTSGSVQEPGGAEPVRQQLPGAGRASRRSSPPPTTGLDRWGYGLASVRFICGTQEIHKQLEAKLSEFLGTEDTILYSSCFDANGGLFETLLGPEDAVISDELNHASIIDGVRLCKAQRFRYENNDMADLEAKLQEAAAARLPHDRHRRRLLDGRLHRQLAGDLRPGRQVRRAGDGRRLARRRLHGPTRPRHARVPRRDGPRRHHHRHAGQGAGRRQRRLHQRPPGDHRAAAAAVATLSVLELAGPADRRRLDQRAGTA